MPARAKARKATFSLRPDLLSALDDAIAKGAAPSKNALVEQALRLELRRIRRRALAAAWEEAARDPLFMRDVEEVQAAFESADAETARAIR